MTDDQQVKLTAQDIRQHEFKRGLRGYAEADVDEYLDAVANQLEEQQAEAQKMEAQLQAVSQQLAHYRQMEDVLQKTMIGAQANADAVCQEAEQKAQTRLQEADAQIRQMMDQAHAERSAVEQTIAGLQAVEQDFRRRFNELLDGFKQSSGETPLEPRQAAAFASPAPAASCAAADEISDFADQAAAVRAAMAREVYAEPPAATSAAPQPPSASAPAVPAASGAPVASASAHGAVAHATPVATTASPSPLAASTASPSPVAASTPSPVAATEAPWSAASPPEAPRRSATGVASPRPAAATAASPAPELDATPPPEVSAADVAAFEALAGDAGASAADPAYDVGPSAEVTSTGLPSVQRIFDDPNTYLADADTGRLETGHEFRW